ncbi:MAG: BatD family protein [Verrucomicrobiota bacterium]|nr:BatD family protein [Verrucomicrobiota bacterium]
MRFPSSLAVVLSFVLAGATIAATPNVTAVLTDSQTVVGRPVRLEVQITGASNPKPPGEIEVDGLDIRYAGTSRQVQMNNFNVSYSLTYTYTVMPLKAGTFKIPPQEVEAGGNVLRTPELTLAVAASGSPQTGRSGRGNNNSNSINPDIDPSQIGFLEMILPKTTAYVGEVVPVQLRLGLSARTPIESLSQGVQISGQGFTTQKMPEPRQTVESINGRTYQVFIFKTAISAARAGKIEIGPAEINPVVRVPRAPQRNPGQPRDPFDDPFSMFNQMFNDPAFAPSVAKEVKLASKPATLDVKPLPPNAPPTFTGAVGTFTLKADANPKKAQAGDPVTVVATVTGRGNFDRVTAPTLEDENGWHLYPPSNGFKQDDDVGISGAKTFETVVSGKERKDKLPPLLFSYFDPVKEGYVTLRSEPIPLQISGPAPAAATATPAGSSAAVPVGSPSPVATPAQKQEPADILAQLDDRVVGQQSFTPLYARRSFWAAQLLPLLALCGFIAWNLRQAGRNNRAAQRLARLHAETAELQRQLAGDGSSSQQYIAAASRVVQLKAALATHIDPDAVDAETAANAFRLDEPGRVRLQELFAQSDELRYSGANGGNGLSPQRKQEIRELVESLRT